MADYKISGARLTDIANSIRSKTGSTDPLYVYQMATAIDDIVVGGGAAPDGMEVTFGYEDGAPVEREEAYTILGATLNELGKITQAMAGKTALMTLDEMLYHLNRAKYLPYGIASSEFNSPSFVSSVVAELQEG
jgi:hypothetical protein